MIFGVVSHQAQLGEHIGKKSGQALGNRVWIGAADPIAGDCFVRESIHRISPCNWSQRGTKAETLMADIPVRNGIAKTFRSRRGGLKVHVVGHLPTHTAPVRWVRRRTLTDRAPVAVAAAVD